MPDAGASPDDGPPQFEKARSEENSPDLVGEELADGAHIWRVYDRFSRDEDRERIGNWNRGLDNLALFAGLFSAVTTAFIIELRQDTEPDYSQLTFMVLNASAAGLPFEDQPFTIDPSVQLTNCLWIASLMLSLTAALIAIMGKDWIGMYASRPACNPRQWAEIRTYRVMCAERWYMSGVIASAPVLLHISLILFAAGLVIFVAPDRLSQRVALGFALAAGGLYLVTVLSAILLPTSPFKSPATQAVRGPLLALFEWLRDRIAHPHRNRPIVLLQQATLLIGTLVSRPLPATIIPLDPRERRRLRRGDMAMLWELLSAHIPANPQSWRDTVRIFAQALITWTGALKGTVYACVRSVVDDYHYRRQRPHTRPWYLALGMYMRQVEIADSWADVRIEPTPALLAQSLSHLSAMTQSTDVLRAILVAIGDIAIGRHVAPLVSLDLRARLATEIRRNWQQTDLQTLSRLILADHHLPGGHLPPFEVSLRFRKNSEPIKSVSIIFALVLNGHTSTRDIDRYCPDLLVQPRTIQHLLRSEVAISLLILLAKQYWSHWQNDLSVNLTAELKQRMVFSQRERYEAQLATRFENRSGLLEMLVFLIDGMNPANVSTACELILMVIAAEYRLCVPCLVDVFGHDDPETSRAAWAALSMQRPLKSYGSPEMLLEGALPLDLFRPRNGKEKVVLPVSDGRSPFALCLARAVVRLLLPSRAIYNLFRIWPTEDSETGFCTSTLELCVQCLHTLLFRPSKALDNKQTLEIITLLLEDAVLIRGYNFWGDAYLSRPAPAGERVFNNILTAIARWLTRMLTCEDTRGDGERLFHLFAFSQTADGKGGRLTWDLGVYVRATCARLPEGDPRISVSVRRLIVAIRALRPLCALSDDLRAAWERINLPVDDEYRDPFWDDEDFVLILPLGLPERTMPPSTTEEFTALQWLDAAMR